MNCLGIDYGTTSVKAMLFNERLEELAFDVIDYTLNTRGSFVEIEPQKYTEILMETLANI